MTASIERNLPNQKHQVFAHWGDVCRLWDLPFDLAHISYDPILELLILSYGPQGRVLACKPLHGGLWGTV